VGYCEHGNELQVRCNAGLRRINVSIIFVWPFPYLACKNLLPSALYCSSSAQKVGHPIWKEVRGALQLTGDASENK